MVIEAFLMVGNSILFKCYVATINEVALIKKNKLQAKFED